MHSVVLFGQSPLTKPPSPRTTTANRVSYPAPLKHPPYPRLGIVLHIIPLRFGNDIRPIQVGPSRRFHVPPEPVREGGLGQTEHPRAKLEALELVGIHQFIERGVVDGDDVEFLSSG